MKTIFVLAAVSAALLSLSLPAQAGLWQTYANERFGATAEVPATWKAGEPPENGDGLEFTSPDGQATIIVSGMLNIDDSLDAAFASREEAFEGETITYKHRDKHSVVVSGTKGDRIFYRKSLLACRNQVWDSVSIEYPAAQKQAFDAIVTTVARSLKAGPSEQVAECNG
jgi:serine/threonine-protein kinase